MKRFASAGVAIVAMTAGLLALVGYFTDAPAIAGFRVLLLDWAVILAGIATLVGVGNLFSVHLQKVRQRGKGYLYSLWLLVCLLIALFLGVTPGLEAAQHLMLNAIVIPIEISLMALLSVSLLYFLVRSLRQRPSFSLLVFSATVFLTLLGAVSWPFLGQIPLLSDIRATISQTLALGGARGLLLGIALGSITTGLRVLLGADRPYGGK